MNFLCVLSIVVVGLSHYATAQWYQPSCPNGYLVQPNDSYWKISGGNSYFTMCAYINANPYNPNLPLSFTNINPCNLQVGQCISIPQSWTSTSCPSTCTCCGSASGTNTYGSYYGSGTYGYPSGYFGSYTYTGCGATNQYTVQAGNTFYSLGGSTMAGMCAWRNANPTVDPCNLQIGQCLNQPTSSTSTTCATSYTSSYSCGYAIPTGSYGTYTGPTYTTYNGTANCNCAPYLYCVKPGDTLCRIGGNTGNMCAWFNANYPNQISDPNSIWVGQCLSFPTAGTSRTCTTSISC